MKSWSEISIGNTTFMWKQFEHYTKILDEEGGPVLELNWLTTEGEVRAAIYGYIDGYIDGKKVSESQGKSKLQRELRKLLNIN